jgi:uncharacterized protein (UPF0276 family)
MPPPDAHLALPELGYGLGLRPQHLKYIDENGPGCDWFEIISENFIDNYGYARYMLDRIREQTPIVMHGVSLSIGSTDPLDFQYLGSIKQLTDELKPAWVSDHLCWTGVMGLNTHELLPLPLTEEVLHHVSRRVISVQDFLERPLVLENPSTYIEFRHSTFSEWEFLNALTAETGCGLLLDLNNVYVSSRNSGYAPDQYIDGIRLDRVVQVHLAGPTDFGGYLIDTHDKPVPAPVWALYDRVRSMGSRAPALLEWDADIPEYRVLLNELDKARQGGDRICSSVFQTPIDAMTPMPVSTPLGFHREHHGNL